MIFLAGCYMNASITSLTPEAPILSFSKMALMENVSGSSHYEVTPINGYRVRQAAGILINKQMAKTPNGYQVFLNVNGRISSQELDQ